MTIHFVSKKAVQPLEESKMQLAFLRKEFLKIEKNL